MKPRFKSVLSKEYRYSYILNQSASFSSLPGIWRLTADLETSFDVQPSLVGLSNTNKIDAANHFQPPKAGEGQQG
jgi:hypothetical protein